MFPGAISNSTLEKSSFDRIWLSFCLGYVWELSEFGVVYLDCSIDSGILFISGRLSDVILRIYFLIRRPSNLMARIRDSSSQSFSNVSEQSFYYSSFIVNNIIIQVRWVTTKLVVQKAANSQHRSKCRPTLQFQTNQVFSVNQSIVMF